MVCLNVEGDCFAIARNDGLGGDCFVVVSPPCNDGGEREDGCPDTILSMKNVVLK